MITTVNTTSGLAAALQTAQAGDTIQLASGTYSELDLNNLNFGGAGVTITSADLSHPATIAGIEVSGSSGLTFSHLAVTVDPYENVGVLVNQSSSNIKLDTLNISGAPGAGTGATATGSGVMIRDSANVTLTNSNIHDVSVGVGNLNSSQVTVTNNAIHDISGDGVDNGGSSNVTISGNYFTNLFVQPGDHPDAIQFWTLNTTTTTHDLTITNNVMVRGTGGDIQGIFLGNEAGITYENVNISGNAILGGLYHGIMVADADHVTVNNNLVEGYSDQVSWIYLNQTTNSSETNNQSTDFYNGTEIVNTGLVQSGNVTIASPAVGNTSILGTFAPAASAVAVGAAAMSGSSTSSPPAAAPVVNQAPSGTNVIDAMTWNSTKALAASDFGFTDPNGNSLLAVKIDTLPTVGSLTDNGVAVAAGQSISVADITGGKLVYHAPSTAGATTAGLTFQVQDNGGTANGGVDTDTTANTLTFNISAQPNQAPSGTNVTDALAWNSAKTLAASDFGFTDPNGNSLLAVKIDTLPTVGSLTDNGVAVTAGQSISVADITGGKLVYHGPTAAGAATAGLTFQVQDNGGTANGGVDTDASANTLTFNISAEPNHAPSGTNVTDALTWNSTKALAVSDFGFTDTDGNTLQSVKIDTLPSAGTLTDNGVNVSAGQSISAADINAGKLIYHAPSAAAATTVGLTFQVQDNGGTANGGVDTDASANTLTFNISAEPTASGSSSSSSSSGSSSPASTPAAPTGPTSGAANASNVMTTSNGHTDVEGTSSNDTISGSASKDYLRGNDGNDFIQGGAGFDDINGNKGDDTIDGGAGGNDWLVGGQGNDLITAHVGQNLLYGNLGDDTLIGGSGGDTLLGGQGDDSIAGGSGNDYISGDRGSDTVSGGAGADTFHSASGAGIDKVLDFNQAQGDHVLLDHGTKYTVSQVGSDTVIDMGHGDEMILANVQLSSLHDGWISVG